jgi:hypothetical protein
MPTQTQTPGEIKGKVLQAGVRSGETVAGKGYAFAWVQLMDGQLREIVEVTRDVSDGSESPFAELQRGQFVSLPVGHLRMYHGMLTGSLVVADDDAGGEESGEDRADF